MHSDSLASKRADESEESLFMILSMHYLRAQCTQVEKAKVVYSLSIYLQCNQLTCTLIK